MMSDSNNIAPMYLAIANDEAVLLKELIESGEDVNKPIVIGYTPVALACQLGKMGCVLELMKHNPDLTIRTDAKSTVLHVAADGGNCEIVHYLLSKHNLDINSLNAQHETPLYFAVLKNNYNLTRLLIAKGSRIDTVSHGYKGFKTIETEVTPLVIASQNDNIEIAEMLLAEGADVNPNVKHGISPLHLACFNGSKRMVRLLLNANADINATNFENITPLHYAVQNNHVQVVKMLLQFDHIDFDKLSYTNYTPLHLSCENGNFEIVKLLLDKGAAIDIRGNNQYTPFHFAVKHSHIEIIEELISRGSKLHTYDSSGCIPLHTAAKNHLPVPTIDKIFTRGYTDINIQSRSGVTLIHLAATSGYMELLEYVIKEKGADHNIFDKHGWHPLHHAAFSGRLNAVQFFLEMPGIDINVRTHHRNTPLHFAVDENHSEVVEYLLDNGAKIDACELNKWTPLHLAVYNGYEDIVIILLQRSADVTKREAMNGRSMLHLAAQKKHAKVINALVEYGADMNAKMSLTLTAMHQAALHGNIDTVRALLIKGARFDTKTSCRSKIDWTPVHLVESNSLTKVTKYLKRHESLFEAIKTGNTDGVMCCVEDGVHLNCRSVRYKTPLIYASWKGYLNVVILLLKYGANVNVAAEGNVTALHYAAQYNNIEVVYCLLRNGAIFNAATTDKNMTPLEFAKRMQNVEIVRILQTITDLFEDVLEPSKTETVQQFLKDIRNENHNEYCACLAARNNELKTMLQISYQSPPGSDNDEKHKKKQMNVPVEQENQQLDRCVNNENQTEAIKEQLQVKHKKQPNKVNDQRQTHESLQKHNEQMETPKALEDQKSQVEQQQQVIQKSKRKRIKRMSKYEKNEPENGKLETHNEKDEQRKPMQKSKVHTPNIPKKQDLNSLCENTDWTEKSEEKHNGKKNAMSGNKSKKENPECVNQTLEIKSSQKLHGSVKTQNKRDNTLNKRNNNTLKKQILLAKAGEENKKNVGETEYFKLQELTKRKFAAQKTE